jgi:hypothetical protein
MSNPYKNEMNVKIGEVEILLRPDFENLSSFEANVMTLDEFAFKLVKGKLPSLTQLVKTIYFFQVEKKYDLEQINQMVQESEGIALNRQVMPFLSGCVSGYKNKADAKKSADKAISESEKKS